MTGGNGYLRAVGGALWTAKLRLQRLVMFTVSMGFTILVALQVILRYFMDVPLYWVEETAVYLAVWLYFIGASYGAYARSHISASLMEVVLPAGRVRDAIAIVANLLTAGLSVWVCVWMFGYFSWSLERMPRSVTLDIAMFWVHAAGIVGLTLMTLYFFIELLERLLAFVRRVSYEPGSGWSESII